VWAGVVTLFPEMFTALTESGVTGRAVRRGQLEVAFSSPRDHAHDRHRTVDDRPFGGGPGMLMKVEPLLEAIDVCAYRPRTIAKITRWGVLIITDSYNVPLAIS